MIGPNGRPVFIDTSRIEAGDPYTSPSGHPATADHSGMLLAQTGQIICEERLVEILSSGGRWKIKRRK